MQKIAEALGLKVLIAERKGQETAREGRTPFKQMLKECTVLIITAPLDDTTRDMISAAEVKMMHKTAMIVNVGRGGIIDEAAVAQALRDGRLGGMGTDVFETEPVGKGTSPLLDPDVPNVVASPHIAWYSLRTLTNMKNTVVENAELFVKGNPQHVVIPGLGARDP